MPLTSGVRLGPYEIVAVIGVGGMGEVYRARDTRLRRDVALKVLPALPEGLGSPILDEYAVTADGQTFLVAEPIRARGVPPISVIVNWPTRVP